MSEWEQDRQHARRVVICGAGVGGLALAALLARNGHRPVVIEVRNEASATDQGAFLTLAPNGMNGLRAVGCYEAVRAAGIETTGIEIQNARGKSLALADQRDHEAVFGAPSVTIGRGRLVALLLECARAVGVDIRFGRRVADVETTPDRVVVHLQDRSVLESDIAVAADGLRSTVRERIFAEYPEPQFTGLIGTGGMTDARVSDTAGVMRLTFGDNAFFGYLKAAGEPVCWFNSYAAEVAEPAWVSDPAAYARRIAGMHAGDPAPNAEILASVERIERNYPVYDMPALPRWHRDRVVMIGDAAHAVGPHAGQGASMAIEDALVLAACLAAEPTRESAFCRYEALRRPRVEEVVRLTARNSSQKRAAGWLALLIRDLVLPLLIPIGIRQARKLLEHRVDLDPLSPNPRPASGRRRREVAWSRASAA
jgi:2-polyprenyl-6-methoxyphenol hydroxylase-like FAD-dependent oxidoreductase